METLGEQSSSLGLMNKKIEINMMRQRKTGKRLRVGGFQRLKKVNLVRIFLINFYLDPINVIQLFGSYFCLVNSCFGVE